MREEEPSSKRILLGHGASLGESDEARRRILEGEAHTEATWAKTEDRAAIHGSVGSVTTVKRVPITLPKSQDIRAEPTTTDDPIT